MTQHDTISINAESSVSLTSEHKDIIADTIGKLQDTVNLATNDFLLVAAFLKNLNDRSKFIKSVDLGVEVSRIVTELQYIDALKQRIDHMIFFLEEICGLKQVDQAYSAEMINNYRKTCGLIFQLNFYQLKVAKADFVKSVEKIQTELSALKRLPEARHEFRVQPKDIFSHFNQVINKIREVAHCFIQLSALFPVSSEVRSLSIVRHLLNRYTMESEREVLRWCMDYIEDNSVGELKIEELREAQIQLF